MGEQLMRATEDRSKEAQAILSMARYKAVKAAVKPGDIIESKINIDGDILDPGLYARYIVTDLYTHHFFCEGAKGVMRSFCYPDLLTGAVRRIKRR